MKYTAMPPLLLQLLSVVVASIAFAAGADLPAGAAKGTCAKDGAAPVALAHAGAFIDQKDEQKPTLLILSDIKLPIASWKSEFDLMLAKPPFSGAIFFLDKEGAVFRTDFYWKGRQASVSGYFTLKLESRTGKDLVGSVTSDAGDRDAPKVDATFHAVIP